jgi:integrase
MPSRGTLKHVLNCVSVVLDDLHRKQAVEGNIARLATFPKRKKLDNERSKERSVLTDFELARYLAWRHPDERHQVATLERQTMSCIARLFGGLRTGDLHVLDWSSIDTTNGAFTWGYAPRAKAGKSQKLAIDEMLRPILRRWWQAKGQPHKGLVFPALRDGTHSNAGQGEKHEVSHADSFRRDLRRAFGVDRIERVVTKQKNGRFMPVHKWLPCRELTAREVELFEGNSHSLPVDFHSWRRAYCQHLADAGVNAQLAKSLAGHATEAAHDRYLLNSEMARELPEAARPQIDLSKVIQSKR